MEGEAAGGPLQWILGSLQSWTTILPRDHWTWAYAVAMKGLSYFSWG